LQDFTPADVAALECPAQSAIRHQDTTTRRGSRGDSGLINKAISRICQRGRDDERENSKDHGHGSNDQESRVNLSIGTAIEHRNCDTHNNRVKLLNLPACWIRLVSVADGSLAST